MNFIEDESRLSRHIAKDTFVEFQIAEPHAVSSLLPFSSSNDAGQFGQQSLNLLSNNSVSDPVLSTSTLISLTDNTHEVLALTEDETIQHCMNEASLAECQTAVDSIHSPASFYLSSTVHLSSNSSSSSDNGVSILLTNIYVFNNWMYKRNPSL